MTKSPKQTLLRIIDGLITQGQPLTGAGYASVQGDGYAGITVNYPADATIYAQFDAGVSNFVRML